MYTKCGQHLRAIQLWKTLCSQPPVSAAAYLSPLVCTNVLGSCAQLATTFALDQGTYIHYLVQSGAVKPDVQLYTSLMNMYVKCWQPGRALQVWTELKQSGHNITSYITCVCALNACANVGSPEALRIGKEIHSLVTSRCWNQPNLFNTLVAMYTVWRAWSCGATVEAAPTEPTCIY
jgi:PPR repeat